MRKVQVTIRFLNGRTYLMLVIYLFLSCNSKNNKNVEIHNSIQNNNHFATVIINNPFKKKLRLEYLNNNGLQYFTTNLKNDTIRIKLEKRSFLNVKDLGLKKGNPFLANGINLFVKDTFFIDNSLTRSSYTFLNRTRSNYNKLIRDLHVVKKRKEIDSIRKFLIINKLFNKTSISKLQQMKYEYFTTQLKLIDSINLINKNDNNYYYIKDELKYRYYLGNFLDLNLFKKSYILDSLYTKKYLLKKELLKSAFKFDYLKNFATLLSIKLNKEHIYYDNTNVYEELEKYLDNENLKIARQFFLLNIINSNNDKSIRTKYRNKYFKQYKDSQFQSFLKNYYDFQKEANSNKNLKVSTQFELNLRDVKGKKDITLKKIIQNNKEKVLLIDFWASWCKPCRLSFPDASNLRKYYSKKNFVYIYISIDKIPSKWYKAIKEEGLISYNNNYITSGGKNEFFKNINLDYIPRYLIIDKEGKIVELYSPNPGTKKIRELLNRYLTR